MTPTKATEPRTKKGEQTRSHILEIALNMFRERGYDGTTMRAVADEAGVSLGNAYYYFESKEYLIQAFYERSHEEHLAASRDVLESERDFRKRLVGVLRAKLGSSMPYHRFSGLLFKTAADPRSPLNPFSDDSTAVREESIALFEQVLNDSDTRVHHSLAPRLPELLWLYQMGIILYWIHDDSPGCDRSYRLIDRSADLVVKLIKLANLPPMRPATRVALNLLDDLHDEDDHDA